MTKKGKTIVPIIGNFSDPKEIANLFALNYKRLCPGEFLLSTMIHIIKNRLGDSSCVTNYK